jgi:FAD/FMN-containing dehydrogenase/Fe-S oxidoreductase
MATRVAEAETQSLVEELGRLVEGEVRFDKMTRLLYSTDASIYQIEPIGVVIPKTAEDVIAVVETANRHGVPVLPRGGGTSLAGQTVGGAIVIDFSKYMRNVIEVNPDEGWVHTQPGIILDELNAHLGPTGMMFAPDPSTSSRGNVGGALGNNSCGAHSILWGKTVDNVVDLNVVLSDGTTARFGALDGEQLEAKLRADGLEGEIYRKLFEVGEANREEVLRRYPKIQRRVSGYNLDEFVGGSDFDMARFVVGSEGTLVAITDARLRIVPRPRHKALAVLHFHELLESMEATVATLEMDPAAVELIGSMIIRQARTNLQYSRLTDFIEGDPEALLVVELNGESEAEVESKLDALDERMARSRLGYATRRVVKAEDQAKVWAVRKAGLGLMMNVPGKAKPLPFVEDTAVSPEVLPEFVRRFDEIVRDHGTTAGYYGHASVGCLHIRPLIDLTLQDDVDRMVSIATQISDLTLEFGGSMSGEHGDGLVRSHWNEKMFGSQIYEAFRQVKAAFDPKGIMNPGKIVDGPPMTENLRTSPAYRTREVKTAFAYAQEGSFADAIDMCNGQGACRKVLGGTMCPSYMVTRDEQDSTRGRAMALRAAMSGALPPESLTGRRLHEVMDLCLECKGCKAECPSNVDMAKLKYEFMGKYREEHGSSMRDLLFGNIATLSRWGSFFAPVSNWSLRSGALRSVLDSQVGIDGRRRIPEFASQSFRQWFRARGGSPASNGVKGQVVLFPDTFTDYNHPNLGMAATKVLENLGFQVIVPNTRCCGRPMLSKGMMDKAQRNARFNVETVYPYIEQGAKLVGVEPSCILSFQDDYVDLLGGDAKARAVSESTMLVEEFVIYAQEEHGSSLDFKGTAPRTLFHGHCHQKALVGTGPAMEVLRLLPGSDTTEIPSGCCGMAGSFGFEKEHYDMSMRIGEQVLFPAIRAQEGEFVVVSEGVSCRQQIGQGTGRAAKHLVEVLADAL